MVRVGEPVPDDLASAKVSLPMVVTLFALTFTLVNEMRTVPVTIALMTGASRYELPWGNIMAASVIVTVPVVALVLIFQRRIVSSLTACAVKG